MKRYFIGLFLMVYAIGLNAQDYKFKAGKDGNCEIIDTISINVSESDCYRIIKEWLYTISCVSLSFSNEVKDKSLSFNNIFYTEKRYNSFSGTYTNNLEINCDMKIENGKLIYHLYDMSLIKAYSGYGADTHKLPVAERIFKIDRAKNEILRLNADKSLSKAERRDALEEQEEILKDVEVLAKCYDVLMARIDNLKKMVQWVNSEEAETEDVPEF